MAEQGPPNSDAPEGQEPRPGPARPPQRSGPVPMTVTRSRLGTGRGGAGSAPARPPAQTAASEPSAEQIPDAEPAEQPAPPARPTPPSRPAAAGAPPRVPPRPVAASPGGESGSPQRPAPARPAAAAARPGGAAVAERPATTERLAAAVRREPAAATAGGAAQSENLVYVWPHLVSIEFISALVMLLSMILLSWVVNAPLEGHANPDKTPNPSKAPWYFLNLQELLLHMHPALAGVLVPAGALTLIAAIPYFDRDTRDVGKWFGTSKAIPITIFVAIYTTLVEFALVIFDENIGVKPLMNMVAAATGMSYFGEVEPFGIALFSMPNVIVPTILMLGPILPMMLVIVRRWKPSTREVMIALFTGFVTSYVILTIFGTFFRGQGMHLCWLTDPCQIRIE